MLYSSVLTKKESNLTFSSPLSEIKLAIFMEKLHKLTKSGQVISAKKILQSEVSRAAVLNIQH